MAKTAKFVDCVTEYSAIMSDISARRSQPIYLLTGDEGIHQINLDMRDVDRPTDVLSFPMFELEPGVPPEGEDYLDPATGLWVIQPGVAVLTVTGTV